MSNISAERVHIYVGSMMIVSAVVGTTMVMQSQPVSVFWATVVLSLAGVGAVAILGGAQRMIDAASGHTPAVDAHNGPLRVHRAPQALRAIGTAIVRSGVIMVLFGLALTAVYGDVLAGAVAPSAGVAFAVTVMADLALGMFRRHYQETK